MCQIVSAQTCNILQLSVETSNWVTNRKHATRITDHLGCHHESGHQRCTGVMIEIAVSDGLEMRLAAWLSD